MISNFNFLSIDMDTAELFRTINMAEENYTHGDYEGTLTKVRKVVENTARLIADREYLELSERSTFNDVLREIKGLIPNKTIVDRFYDIKGKGNNSAHKLNPEDATKENALKALKQVFDILAWFMLTYIDPAIKESAIGQFLEPRAQELYTTAERKFIYVQTVNRLDINEFALSCGVQFLSSWFQKLTNSALFNSRVNVSQHKPSKDIKNLFKSLQSIFFGGIFGIEFVCGIISFSLDIIKAINDGFVWNEAFDFSQDIIKSGALRKFQIFSVCNQSSRIFDNFSDLGQRSFIVTMCVIFLSHIDGSEKFRRIHING